METSIWKKPGVIPYLLIIFLNTFTDLGHKIIIQNTLFKFYEGAELRVYTALVQAMILLPFVLTVSPAGFLADRFPKHLVMRYSVFAALPLTALITVCYYQGAFWPAFWLTLLLALQSAIFSPAKYGYIRELVGKENLAAGNSVVQALTIVAILGGILCYSLIFEHFFIAGTTIGDVLYSVRYAGFVLMASIALGWLLAYALPDRGKGEEALRFYFKKYINTSYLRHNLRAVYNNRNIWLCIIGLSVFFAINQVLLATFGAHLKEVAGVIDTRVANAILALGGIGIILGSVYAGRVSKHFIETGIIPLGALGLCLSLGAIPLVTNLSALVVVFVAAGYFGGMFIVPLNALIQYHAKEGEAGMILASNNFVQNIFMLCFLGFSIGLALLDISNRTIFYLLAAVTFGGAVYAVLQLPQSFVSHLLSILLKRRYRMQVNGIEHIPVSGGVLLLGNHVSWLDWAVLQICCPRRIRFVMLRSLYDKWYLRWFLDIFKVIPIGQTASRQALQEVRESLEMGEVVALFPEGHISHNGHLDIFKAGFEKAVQDTGAQIVPFYLRGLWGSRFSYASGKFRESARDGAHRILTVAFGPPCSSQADAATVKQAVQATSIQAWNSYVEKQEVLAVSFLKTAKSLFQAPALIEGTTSLSFGRLLAAVLFFSKRLKKHLVSQENIGILLPASSGAVIANLVSLLHGKAVVNLNYTASPQGVAHAMQSARVRIVLTSKKFLSRLAAKGIDLTPLQDQARFLCLEEVGEPIGKGSQAAAFLTAALLPTTLLMWLYFRDAARQQLTDTAAILFSSGSEGTPKGVLLSHANIQANLKQIATVLNPTAEDVVLNALPTFHAFGLTVTTFMPMIEGLPMVCHPDPTDARGIGRLVAQHKVSIMAGTSTFFRIYTRSKRVHPLMFESVRVVVAGAERLQPEVRSGFKEKFGKDILEGYGATETAPVTSVNVPDVLLSWSGEVQVGNKPGTVGLPVPGTHVAIVDPETMEALPQGEAGMVLVAGPQVMKGYLNMPEKDDEVFAEINNTRWYKTGDKGRLDEDGFLQILDRYSRFAKLGGEMVSLGAVEAQAAEVIEDDTIEILAVALPDSAKGEKVILLVAGCDNIEELQQRVRDCGMNPLMQPKEFLKVEAIPKLGSGKADFTAAKRLAQEIGHGE